MAVWSLCDKEKSTRITVSHDTINPESYTRTFGVLFVLRLTCALSVTYIVSPGLTSYGGVQDSLTL